MTTLPYITAAGNIEKALNGIKSASLPDKVSQDFVKTILQIKGGSGNQITSLLKKIGFAGPDGSPSEIYRRFRNPEQSSNAILEALKIGYAPLFVRNEYMHKLPDTQLRGLIIEVTGQGDDSNVVNCVFTSIKKLKKFIDETQTDHSTRNHSNALIPPTTEINDNHHPSEDSTKTQLNKAVGLNLAYTINLNLPATADIAVFNAIFKSLKEHLLAGQNE